MPTTLVSPEKRRYLFPLAGTQVADSHLLISFRRIFSSLTAPSTPGSPRQLSMDDLRKQRNVGIPLINVYLCPSTYLRYKELLVSDIEYLHARIMRERNQFTIDNRGRIGQVGRGGYDKLFRYLTDAGRRVSSWCRRI